MTHSEKLTFLLEYLLAESPKYASFDIPSSESEKFRLFRSLVNIRPPKQIDRTFLDTQDEFLKEELDFKGITDISSLKPIEENIYLWQGDITTLKCGAIVNAANSQMLGCFCPCHACIDNCIHTFAGVQLRLECEEIMKKQGFAEPTGKAKLTLAYNLPCNYVIHTVGPIVNGILTKSHCEALENSYRSCLDIAVQNNIDSIAFCCISTGEFHFPNDKAAEIAVKTVREFTKGNNIKVIFNVFKDIDLEIYKKLLG